MIQALSRVTRPLLSAMHAAPHVLLALDYDGTLAPVQADHYTVYLSEAQKALLQDLADHPHVTMALVSGRSVADLRGRLPLRGIYYIGNHGFEICHGRRWIERPAADTLRTLRAAERALLEEWQHVSGVIIENKGPVVVAHYRRVPRAQWEQCGDALATSLKRVTRGTGLQSVPGKTVFELRPRSQHHKGWAVRQVLERMPPHTQVIAMGDDTTDEDMFRSLSGEHVTIHVGRSPHTAAQYRTVSPRTVWRWLEDLAASLNSC